MGLERQEMRYLIAVSIFMLLCANVNAVLLKSLKAAVLEAGDISPKSCRTNSCKRHEALEVLQPTLDRFLIEIARAAEQGADILVLPECSVIGCGHTRGAMRPFLELIPDPKTVTWNPCLEPERYPERVDVLKFFSCAARHNNISIVVNLGDEKKCNSSEQPLCPSDGRFQFNTDVVFDKQGQLIARYHKRNLWQGEELFFDFPEIEYITFDTEFGRFGLSTCYDILFKEPTVTLVKDYAIDVLLFPTAWMNVVPFYPGISYHSSFAESHGIYLLGAEMHDPSTNMTGSGIYSPQGSLISYHNMSDTEGFKLLVYDIYPMPSHPPIYWSATNDQVSNPSAGASDIDIDGDLFSVVVLESSGRDGQTLHEKQVCNNDLCCKVQYSMTPGETVVLGAFSGQHSDNRHYYTQVCAVIRCGGSDLTSCGRNDVTTSSVVFYRLELTGNFSTPDVYPEVVLSGPRVDRHVYQLQSDGRLQVSNATETPILTAALFGRWYEKDAPFNPINNI